MTKISYGLSNVIEKEFDREYTVGQLLRDRSVLSVLNAPENVTAVSAGETLNAGDYVADYRSITLSKEAADKA